MALSPSVLLNFYLVVVLQMPSTELIMVVMEVKITIVHMLPHDSLALYEHWLPCYNASTIKPFQKTTKNICCGWEINGSRKKNWKENVYVWQRRASPVRSDDQSIWAHMRQYLAISRYRAKKYYLYCEHTVFVLVCGCLSYCVNVSLLFVATLLPG